MPINHISLTVTDIVKIRDFYVAALKPLGYKVMMSFMDDKVLGLGSGYGPDFWLASADVPNSDGKRRSRYDIMRPDVKPVQRSPSGKLHIAFGASSRQQVRDFYEAAM